MHVFPHRALNMMFSSSSLLTALNDSETKTILSLEIAKDIIRLQGQQILRVRAKPGKAQACSKHQPPNGDAGDDTEDDIEDDSENEEHLFRVDTAFQGPSPFDSVWSSDEEDRYLVQAATLSSVEEPPSKSQSSTSSTGSAGVGPTVSGADMQGEASHRLPLFSTKSSIHNSSILFSRKQRVTIFIYFPHKVEIHCGRGHLLLEGARISFDILKRPEEAKLDIDSNQIHDSEVFMEIIFKNRDTS
ncbi:hypothetical protein F5876DRAFT_71123 [Lentinula aff. lateritia]|uniref:Uncharacterized protein n=1 Tax=Lentinula aff. lateritia TaxID=2804960 RepID=A0ACC1TGT0_9AGAR|nr:hypothetical protein F5876DRAFT_71123 [Lentinula aff. lateritia]